MVLRGRAVALLLRFRADRGEGVGVTRALLALQAVRVPVILTALPVILVALSLSGDGTCHEQWHDEHQSEQTASE